jgi:hypothetical protein
MLKIAPDYQVGRWTGDDPRTLRNLYATVDSDDILLAIKGFADHHAEADFAFPAINQSGTVSAE